jgi:hypothetical protein
MVRRPARGRALLIVTSSLIVGVVVGLLLRWAEPIMDRLTGIVSDIGGIYLTQYDASRTTAAGTSEYLIVLSGNADPVSYVTFFEHHPDIEYLSESIYPNTLRVALKIPVRQALDDLNAQPFVGFVIRNYPFLLCH